MLDDDVDSYLLDASISVCRKLEGREQAKQRVFSVQLERRFRLTEKSQVKTRRPLHAAVAGFYHLGYDTVPLFNGLLRLATRLIPVSLTDHHL